MQIIDALRRSNSADEICFLLTNYIEALQFYAVAERLPPAVVKLPVHGASDVEQRYFGVRETGLCDLARSHRATHSDMLAETEEVLYEALCRLRALGMAGEPPASQAAPAEVHAHA